MRISDWSSDVCSSDLRRARRAAGRAHRRPRRAGDEMKPLLICDCDEVLLHMVCHFGTWLRETHDICFTPDGGDFARSMTRQDGTRPTPEEMWGLLGEFFPAELHRQTLEVGRAAWREEGG